MEGYITVILGVVCIVLGVLNLLGNVSTLHEYHRKRVSAEDMPIFARLIGIGTIILGVGFIALGALGTLAESLGAPTYEAVGNVIFIATLVVGLGLSLFAMIKYNKGIF